MNLTQYRMFGDMLSYKTNVVWVKPKNSSLKCSECNFIDAKNRKSQSEFECICCGHEENADVNAAKNHKSEGIAFIETQKICA